MVKTIAPWIGTAFGGPLGGMAVSAIANALGLSDKAEDSIKQALSGATPEQMLALKKADNDFRLQMGQLGFSNIKDLGKIAADDRASARLMQTATRSIVPPVLAVMVTLGFFGILTGVMVGSFSVSPNNQSLLIMLGSLSTAWGMVVSFYFGSSSDSQRKTEMMVK